MRAEVELSIGGELRPAKFGINQAAKFCEVRGCDYAEYFALIAIQAESMNPAIVRDLIYSGLWSGTKERTFDQEDVGDWLDELDVEGLTSILNKVFTTIAASVPKTDDKKKVKVSR